MNRNRGLTPLAVVLMLSGSLALTGCNDKEAQQGAPKAPEVGVVTLKTEAMNVTTELPGRTASFRIAEVRPQVTGIILKRNFVEGSDIKAGMSLYQIDPATYQAAYDSAKGDLVKAQASAQVARVTVNRYKPLLGTNYVSKQDYDTAFSTAAQADAAVVAAKAAVESARINLAYTKVTSPISGRIGKSAVTEGALVTNGQADALATVQQLDPIYVDVTQSSNDFLRLKQELADGSLKQANGKAQVKLLLDNGSEYKQAGTLEFSDVTVDETTGSITLRAVFPNPDDALLPGMFVRARLDEGVNNNALLVPQQGITRNPRGDATAMVVGADNKVELRTVTTTQAIGDKWVVTEGLKSGDKVIVTGLQKIKPGVQVNAQEVDQNADAKKQAASDTAPKS
ncbi:membrane fusion protein, multidrug efflux system [Ewingella americana]|jgi:membrane fusion protein (multidrug efflux system)|uniref:Membrane fusion protein of RND family multidrug efflux pump n=2 Tax=Ewingella americana TaxID=41202 RepID=A0A085G757_EWIA3|nr:efflux RND transporter periplasmic adaptor subunit [Ewingella americana]KAA8726178.1 efflux RND transporter periplasmic adaptor subunit [Ewingella americana]KFC79552.1 membrane fusion protein of RND family multidrug efflux pump [Ewingella americana ATCC 33852]MRT02173.1 efflux RND transporter periplasmic adaptor subunit [Ewingella americana]PKB87574.1 efflux transporter periplasmic adaptor subunit [Ewingella americana]STQ43464.1 Acriflavine resistance protein A precursor [Ewingella american